MHPSLYPPVFVDNGGYHLSALGFFYFKLVDLNKKINFS